MTETISQPDTIEPEPPALPTSPATAPVGRDPEGDGSETTTATEAGEPAGLTRRSDDRATDDPPAILFVDDEPAVLAGLRNSLRRLRRTYRFHFAVGPEEAMTVLAEEPIDVVVTDMRMPGMSGVDLLQEVKAEHPQIIRYVLSGEAERDLVVRAVPVAHRWLTKPCDRETLTDALADAVRCRNLLVDPAIRAAVAGADALPTPPTLYTELCELLDNRDVAIGAVSELVAQDGAISAKLLQWANSAFSGGRRCDTVHDAVIRVGLSALSQMVLLAGVFESLDPSRAIPGFDAEVLRSHVGRVSSLAVELTSPESATTARLGGLFSEVGLLLEATHLPDRLQAAYELAQRTDTTLIETEHRLFGVTYPELGGHLLSVWGLPTDPVVAAVGAHDRPPPDGRFPLPAGQAVQLARLIAQRDPGAEGIEAPHLDRVDGDLAETVERWTAETSGP